VIGLHRYTAVSGYAAVFFALAVHCSVDFWRFTLANYGQRHDMEQKSFRSQVFRTFGGFDDYGGGLDDGDGDTAGLEFQFARGLGAHQ
jgi:hypothetical protein